VAIGWPAVHLVEEPPGAFAGGGLLLVFEVV
jgi:hypothetical protein